MLTRNQALFLMSVAVIGSYSIYKLIMWVSTWDAWRWIISSEFIGTVISIIVLYIFVFGPGKLDDKKQKARQEKDEEDIKQLALRRIEAKQRILEEQHRAHLKFMEMKAKESDAIKTYKFINDLN